MPFGVERPRPGRTPSRWAVSSMKFMRATSSMRRRPRPDERSDMRDRDFKRVSASVCGTAAPGLRAATRVRSVPPSGLRGVIYVICARKVIYVSAP